MSPCPRCGTEPPEDALFCPSCGERVSPTAEAVATEADWDVSRPAMPDDLFRSPEDEPAAPVGPRVTGASGHEQPTDPDATAVRPVVPATMAMPAWPYPPGTPEADLLPSERTYVPPPPPAEQSHGGSGTRAVIILLVLLVAAAIIGGLLWFSGGGSPTAGGSPSRKTSVPAAVSSRGSATTTQSGSLPPSAPPSDVFPPSGASLCSGSTTVAVNGATSCGFAMNVAAAIPQGASGNFTVTASSPVTQKDYQMTCVRGSYTVCSGGVNALVYVK